MNTPPKQTSGDIVLDFRTHSLWLSTQPITPGEQDNTYITPPDDSFVYLGGNISFNYSNTYNATTTGIYGKDSTAAYFIDAASGSVSKISVSAERVQPLSPVDDLSNLNNVSNAKLKKLLYAMKNTVQLRQGAYVLRLYNHTWNIDSEGIAYDFPVFLENYNVSNNLDSPNTIQIQLTFTKRNPLSGITLGNTQYITETSQ